MKRLLMLLALAMVCGTVMAVTPTADFSVVQDPNNPMNITFTDLSAGSPTGWAWFFGDEPYNQSWVQINSTKQLGRSVYSVGAILPNGHIVTAGGNGVDDGKYTLMSSDNGSTWVVQNSSSWGGRRGHALGYLPVGNLFIAFGLGGSFADLYDDVWLSGDEGATWKLRTLTTGAGYGYNTMSAFAPIGDGGYIIKFGGQNSSRYTNETWISGDSGESWSNITSANGWSSRSSASSVITDENVTYIMGGVGTSLYNDTWRSYDFGASWELVNASSGWSVRDYTDAVFQPDGSILLIGGWQTTAPTTIKEVWRSADGGNTWTKLDSISGTDESALKSATVALRDGSIIRSWTNFTDTNLGGVSQFSPQGSNLQNPEHTFASLGNYTISLQAYNDDGKSIIRKTLSIVNTTTPAPTSPSEPSYNTIYTAQPVHLTIVDAYGVPQVGALVSVAYIASSLPSASVDWLISNYGVNESVAIDMVNSSVIQRDYTESTGGFVFTGMPIIRYGITAVNATTGMNHRVEITPKDSHYTIYCPLTGQAKTNNTLLARQNATLPWYSLNNTHLMMGMTYQDTTSCTSSVLFRVWFQINGTEIHNTTWSGIGSSLILDNHTIPKAPIGTEYLWQYNATRVC